MKNEERVIPDRIAALLAEMRKERPEPVECAEIVPGQIRRVDPPSGVDAESRLGVVLIVDEDEGHAVVSIAWSPMSEATTRDVLLPKAATGAVFDLYASVDHVVTVGLDQFRTPRLSGTASDGAVSLLMTGGLLPPDQLRDEAEAVGLETGPLHVQHGDHLWARRIREARAVAQLYPY